MDAANVSVSLDPVGSLEDFDKIVATTHDDDDELEFVDSLEDFDKIVATTHDDDDDEKFEFVESTDEANHVDHEIDHAVNRTTCTTTCFDVKGNEENGPHRSVGCTEPTPTSSSVPSKTTSSSGPNLFQAVEPLGKNRNVGRDLKLKCLLGERAGHVIIRIVDDVDYEYNSAMYDYHIKTHDVLTETRQQAAADFDRIADEILDMIEEKVAMSADLMCHSFVDQLEVMERDPDTLIGTIKIHTDHFFDRAASYSDPDRVSYSDPDEPWSSVLAYITTSVEHLASNLEQLKAVMTTAHLVSALERQKAVVIDSGEQFFCLTTDFLKSYVCPSDDDLIVGFTRRQ